MMRNDSQRNSHTHWLAAQSHTRRPKPAKEGARPAREKKFSKMPYARLKRTTLTQKDKNEFLTD
jgi:hypothetical protein